RNDRRVDGPADRESGQSQDEAQQSDRPDEPTEARRAAEPERRRTAGAISSAGTSIRGWEAGGGATMKVISSKDRAFNAAVKRFTSRSNVQAGSVESTVKTILKAV